MNNVVASVTITSRLKSEKFTVISCSIDKWGEIDINIKGMTDKEAIFDKVGNIDKEASSDIEVSIDKEAIFVKEGNIDKEAIFDKVGNIDKEASSDIEVSIDKEAIFVKEGNIDKEAIFDKVGNIDKEASSDIEVSIDKEAIFVKEGNIDREASSDVQVSIDKEVINDKKYLMSERLVVVVKFILIRRLKLVATLVAGKEEELYVFQKIPKGTTVHPLHGCLKAIGMRSRNDTAYSIPGLTKARLWASSEQFLSSRHFLRFSRLIL